MKKLNPQDQKRIIEEAKSKPYHIVEFKKENEHSFKIFKIKEYPGTSTIKNTKENSKKVKSASSILEVRWVLDKINNLDPYFSLEN